jgi:predicted nucleotidyltransferase component of viral defense system
MLSGSILQMLDKYNCSSVLDYENALKEIIQEVTMLGLWRARFFEHGLFYGGSALRILYDLERFSEDIDLTLLKPDPDFTLEKYFSAILQELESFGFVVQLEAKTKQRSGPIDSAFKKADTLVHFMFINANLKTHPNAKLKIKIEIDRDPPFEYKTENRYHLSPIPFTIKSMTLPSLFAGKLHAVLCRKKVFNIKGRDWYDLIWFVNKKISVNLRYLKEKMIQSGDLWKNQRLNKEVLSELLILKSKEVNFEQAIKDVSPFIKRKTEQDSLELWSPEFFQIAVFPKINIIDFG